MTWGSDTTRTLPLGTVTLNPREMPRAHIVPLLSQVTSPPAPCALTGVSGLGTAVAVTKPRSAAKTQLPAKGPARRSTRDTAILSPPRSSSVLDSDAQGSQAGKSCCPGHPTSRVNTSRLGCIRRSVASRSGRFSFPSALPQ